MLIKALLMSIIVNTVAVSSFASNDAVCQERVSACEHVIDEANKTIAAGEKVINLKTREITAQGELIDLQDKQIQNLSKDKGGLFSNPWFMLTLGIITGALLIRK